VLIFDTTLRDGEQSPGATMNAEEKLEVAAALVDLGVDIIEAGFPIASPGDLAAVKAIAAQCRGVTVAALARCNPADIDAAWEAVREAERPRIHTFVSSSPIHMQHQLRKDPEEVIAMARDGVRRCKGHVADVQFSAMDATRSDWDFLCRMFAAAIEEGATTLNIPDTVGYTMPDEFARLIAHLRAHTPGIEGVVLSVHCHDDLGMATANTLAGVAAGARQVEVTINGIGERAGNTALEEVVMALRTRGDYYGGYRTGIRAERLGAASSTVSRCTGVVVQPNKAIVGANAFAHESGIHQDGVIKERATYEIMTAESVGWTAQGLVMGKHSGRAGFRARLEQLGYAFDAERLQALYERFIALTDRKKRVDDADIVALVEEERQHFDAEPFKLLGWRAGSGSEGRAEAAVILAVEGQECEATGAGNGQVDALFGAIRSLVRLDGELVRYQIDAVTPGEDAQGAVTVTLAAGGQQYSGRGVATDIVEASIRAYLVALNRAAVAARAPARRQAAAAVVS
jgi:2-isopropylmalate synthase